MGFLPSLVSFILLFWHRSGSYFGSEEWPGFKYYNVKAYHFEDSFTDAKTLSNLIQSDSADNKFTNVLLNDVQKSQLLSAVNSFHVSPEMVKYCYLPRDGFVFFDYTGRPIGVIAISFQCGQIEYLPPRKVNSSGELDEFKTLFHNLGLPVKD